MFKHLQILKWLLSLLAAAFLLAGCGGGGGGDPSTTSITGTVATGAAMTGTVDLVDANGATRQATIASDGSFSLDTTGLAAPFILRASGSTILFSLADEASGVFNITPLTTLAVELIRQEWDGTPPADLDQLFTNWNANADPVDLAGLQAAMLQAQAVINANLASQFQANGLTATTYDFLRTAFTPNSTGIDAVLDAIQLAISGAGIQIGVDGSPFSFNVSIDITGFDIGGTGGGGSGGTCTGGTSMTYAQIIAGAYSNGEQVCFTASTTSLSFSGKTLTNPVKNQTVQLPYSAYAFTDSATGYIYEVVFESDVLKEINVSTTNSFLGQFKPASGSGGGSGGSGTLVVSVNAGGISSGSFTITGIPAPSGESDFCGSIQSDSTFGSIGTMNGGTLTVNDCSFSGNVGTVSATLTITSPISMTVPYTLTYTYN